MIVGDAMREFLKRLRRKIAKKKEECLWEIADAV